MTLRQAQDARRMAGATLLEILVAMIIIGMVATGIITAFVFSRRVTWRSSTELSGAGLASETAEALRGAIAGTIANGPNTGLSLTPGIYSNVTMQNSPAPDDTAHRLAALNLPDDFQRFLTNKGTAPNLGDTNNDGFPDHGDGRVVVVEGTVDLDGDGQTGIDFDVPPNGVDLRRVRIRVKWTSPTT